MENFYASGSVLARLDPEYEFKEFEVGKEF